jgi:hypothetical protein
MVIVHFNNKLIAYVNTTFFGTQEQSHARAWETRRAKGEWSKCLASTIVRSAVKTSAKTLS